MLYNSEHIMCLKNSKTNKTGFLEVQTSKNGRIFIIVQSSSSGS